MKADADYAEGIFVGYRWYTTKQVKPLYPFGYGLSYTQFQYSDLQAKPGKDAVEVSFTLSNTGDMDAEEVAQVYIARPQSAIERPAIELKGFKRIALKKGESQTVTLSIPMDKLRHWDEAKGGWALEAGPAVVYAGCSSDNLPLKAEITLAR